MDSMADGDRKATFATTTSESSLGRNSAEAGAAQASTFGTVKELGKQLLAQDSAFKSLINKAGLLECVIEKTRSEQIKNVVQDLLSVLKVFRDSREQVTRSYNVVVDIVRKEEVAKASTIAVAEPAVTEKKDMETQSPCWWDMPPLVGVMNSIL